MARRNTTKTTSKTRPASPKRDLNLGTALREARQQKNVRLRELSAKLDVSLPYLSDVENGRRPLSDERIRQAAEFLGVDPMPLLEVATKDRGKITLDIDVSDERRFRAAMLLSVNWPHIPKSTIDYLLKELA